MGIEQHALDFFSIATAEDLILQRKQIIKQIEDWIKEKENIDNVIKNNYYILKRQEQLGRLSSKNVDKYYDLSSGGLKKLVNNYNQQKKDLQKLQNSKSLEEHLKDGYRIIHYFRDILTGDVIDYSIAYEDSVNGESKEIFEARLNLEQVLSAVSFNFSDILSVKENTKVSNKIKLVINGTSIRNLLKDSEMQEIKNISNKITNKEL